MSNVIWHDVECGRYDADIGLWRELASAASGPILDVGAGTGRVARDLARLSHEVVALDHDAELLAALTERASAERQQVQTVVAIALADTLETFDVRRSLLLPLPDRILVDGALYSSQPVALLDRGDTVAIERIREILTADGRRSASDDVVQLDRVTVAEVEAEGRAAGLTPLPPRAIAATDEHVATSVVMLRG